MHLLLNDSHELHFCREKPCSTACATMLRHSGLWHLVLLSLWTQHPMYSFCWQAGSFPSLTLPRALSDFICCPVFSHLRVQGRTVQRPAVLPASRLNKGCEIGFGDMQPWEPHDRRLTVLNLQTQQQMDWIAASHNPGQREGCLSPLKVHTTSRWSVFSSFPHPWQSP